MNKVITSRLRLTDGLIRQNVVLMSGIAIAPVVACATDYNSALALALGFSTVAFLSVILCRLIPKNIVYTIRVFIYALIAGLMVIPAYLAVSYSYGQAAADALGVYLPVLAVNPLILTKTETRFVLRPFHLMTLELAGYITGFNIVCIGIGIIRDMLANQRIGDYEVAAWLQVSAASTVFGGLIIVGVAAGFFRWQYNLSKERHEKRLAKERELQRMIEEVS
jgi:electron transport complex protein RnfE